MLFFDRDHPLLLIYACCGVIIWFEGMLDSRFGSVHAVGYNSAECETIWIKSGALWVCHRGPWQILLPSLTRLLALFQQLSQGRTSLQAPVCHLVWGQAVLQPPCRWLSPVARREHDMGTWSALHFPIGTIEVDPEIKRNWWSLSGVTWSHFKWCCWVVHM